MGRILSPALVTENNIRDYITQSTKTYSTFISSAPLFCTYYSKNKWKSNFDRSLENIHEVVGSDSPFQFDKVENLPIYKVENSSFGTEITDFGIAGNVTSSAIILPNTLLPNVDDVFEISIQSVLKLFIVTDVEQDNFNNSKFYKISFKLSSLNVSLVEQQVENHLTVDYHLIGSTNDPIIKKSTFDLYLQIEGVYDSLLEEYNDRFYDKSVNMFSDFYSDKLGRVIVDQYLNTFIDKNNLQEYFYSYRNFIYLSLPNRTQNFDNGGRTRDNFFEYKNGYLGSIETGKNTFSHFYNNLIKKTAAKYSNDWFSKVSHYSVVPTSVSISSDSELVLPQDLIDSLVNATVIVTPSLERFISRFVSKAYNETNYHEIMSDIGEPEESTYDYHLIPLALFAIRAIRKILIDKPHVI